MSTQICPKCREDSFTWCMLDETPQSLTYWRCYECGYDALEDERNERKCGRCGNKMETLLKDDEAEYWWCSMCNTAHPNNKTLKA
jgi:rubrerythrin